MEAAGAKFIPKASGARGSSDDTAWMTQLSRGFVPWDIADSAACKYLNVFRSFRVH